MKCLSIDFDKGKDQRKTTNQRDDNSEQRQVCKSIGQKNNSACDQQDQKLPRRNWPKDLVFDINKLWNDKLLHRSRPQYFTAPLYLMKPPLAFAQMSSLFFVPQDMLATTFRTGAF